MADSVDNFSDLQELGIDINESTDSLSLSFTKAANHLQKILPNVDSQTLLTLYGYYKQGTEGCCNISKPSWYDLRAKSKWESWHELGNMPRVKAKQLYVETLKKFDPTFDSTTDDEKASEQWVKVSSMASQESPAESTIVDHIREGNIKEVEKFLKNNKLDFVRDGLSLIHWAADGGNLKVLNKLIEVGADINLLDSDGQTALHYAASCGHIDCVKLLLKKGAKKDVMDNEGCKPFDVAADGDIRDLLK